LHEVVVKLAGVFGASSGVEGWALAAAHVAKESELRDREYGASYIRKAEVHLAGDVFEDPETGETVTVDTSSPSFQKEYKSYCQKQDDARAAQLKRAQVDQIDIETDKDLVSPLVQFFQKRKTR